LWKERGYIRKKRGGTCLGGQRVFWEKEEKGKKCRLLRGDLKTKIARGYGPNPLGEPEKQKVFEEESQTSWAGTMLKRVSQKNLGGDMRLGKPLKPSGFNVYGGFHLGGTGSI